MFSKSSRLIGCAVSGTSCNVDSIPASSDLTSSTIGVAPEKYLLSPVFVSDLNDDPEELNSFSSLSNEFSISIILLLPAAFLISAAVTPGFFSINIPIAVSISVM